METLEANDPDIEVRETAHLAHRRIKFFKEYMGEKYKFNDFGSSKFFEMPSVSGKDRTHNMISTDVVYHPST